jgi:putative flippase GtrA
MRIKQLLKEGRSSTFIRFSIAGGIWTVINIGMMWLLIDVMRLPGWLGSTIGVVILYVGRYYTYLLLKAMEPKFWRYVSASGVFSLLIIGSMTVAVDVCGFKALYSSVVITGLSFIFKYLFFKKVDLIRP